MEVSGSLAGGWWLRLEENQTLLLFFFSIWGPFAINAYSSRYFPQPAEEGYVSAVVLSLNLGSKMWSPFKIQSHSGHTQSIILILGIEDWLKKKKKTVPRTIKQSQDNKNINVCHPISCFHCCLPRGKFLYITQVFIFTKTWLTQYICHI